MSVLRAGREFGLPPVFPMSEAKILRAAAALPRHSLAVREQQRFEDDTRAALRASLRPALPPPGAVAAAALAPAPAPPSSSASSSVASDGFFFAGGDDDDNEAGPAPPEDEDDDDDDEDDEEEAPRALVPQQRRARGRPVGSGITAELRRPVRENEWWSVPESKWDGAEAKEKYRYSAAGKAQEWGVLKSPTCARCVRRGEADDCKAAAGNARCGRCLWARAPKSEGCP
ncbi:hypothetical protein LTR85_002514 [Meristemomyces frigidus]|nr:hypothetical protein LTR85_002514 [Meristemomyces frigidus]